MQAAFRHSEIDRDAESLCHPVIARSDPCFFYTVCRWDSFARRASMSAHYSTGTASNSIRHNHVWTFQFQRHWTNFLPYHPRKLQSPYSFSFSSVSQSCDLADNLPLGFVPTGDFMDNPLALLRPRWGLVLQDHFPSAQAANLLHSSMPGKPGQSDGIQQDQLTNVSQAPKVKPKRWAKRYRTEIAASASSVLSTFFAVS